MRTLAVGIRPLLEMKDEKWGGEARGRMAAPVLRHGRAMTCQWDPGCADRTQSEGAGAPFRFAALGTSPGGGGKEVGIGYDRADVFRAHLIRHPARGRSLDAAFPSR